MKEKLYSELIQLQTFEERFEYLKLNGSVADLTFAGHRWLNQVFYKSPEWKKFRRDIIIRDNGCDLAIPDRIIPDKILIHHINPISIEDIENRNLSVLLNPHNAICVSHNTHNAIHYGDKNLLAPTTPTERKPFDTCPWR